MITEAVLTNKYKDEYIILTEYKMTIKYGTESKTVDFECISDNVFEVDLSGLNIKYTEIYEATFQMWNNLIRFY